MILEFLIAFGAGFITFISPCVLPLIPVYIFYITGIKADEEIDDKFKYIIRILLFILGFTVIFIILGILASLLSFIILKIRFVLNIVFGIIIIIFSLHFMGIINIFFLNYEKRLNIGNISNNIWSPFLIGMGFAAGWTPCIGPILGSILGLVASGSSIIKGVFLLLVFSAGLGLPLFLIALFFNYTKSLVDFLKRNTKIIKIISGIFLFLIGIMILFGVLNNVNIFIVKFAYFLENSMPLSNYVFSGLLFCIGFLLIALMFIRKKLSVYMSIFSAVLIIFSLLNFFNILPILKYIINYLVFSGI